MDQEFDNMRVRVQDNMRVRIQDNMRVRILLPPPLSPPLTNTHTMSSMKYVDQETGMDKDPFQLQSQAEKQKVGLSPKTLKSYTLLYCLKTLKSYTLLYYLKTLKT